MRELLIRQKILPVGANVGVKVVLELCGVSVIAKQLKQDEHLPAAHVTCRDPHADSNHR